MANEFLTITLTSRPPVKIRLADWPILAEAGERDHGGEIESQATRITKWSLKVRQHADGRAIVYATYSHDSHWREERDFRLRGGQMLSSSEDMPAIIQRVADWMEKRLEQGDVYGPGKFPRLAQECVASLPAEDLTTAPAPSDPDRLTWFQALITEYERLMPGEDPIAEQTCLSECRALLAELRPRQ